MNIKINNPEFIKFMQEGGAMAAPTEDPNAAPAEGAPEGAPAGGEDPMQQLAMACQQALETQDCNLAMQVCQALMQMMGGGAPEPAAPEGQQPVFRKGGKLAGWIKK